MMDGIGERCSDGIRMATTAVPGDRHLSFSRALHRPLAVCPPDAGQALAQPAPSRRGGVTGTRVGLNQRVRIGILIVLALGLLIHCASRTRVRVRYRVIPGQPQPELRAPQRTLPLPTRGSRLI